LYINLRDPITQIILIIIVNVAAIIIVEIAIYRNSKKSAISTENRPPRNWKEKLGIETGQDLLIFFVIIGVACSVLITLVFASLGYIVPIPY